VKQCITGNQDTAHTKKSKHTVKLTVRDRRTFETHCKLDFLVLCTDPAIYNTTSGRPRSSAHKLRAMAGWAPQIVSGVCYRIRGPTGCPGPSGQTRCPDLPPALRSGGPRVPRAPIDRFRKEKEPSFFSKYFLFSHG